MKIGILTQPLAANYGGILQNWALQQVLIDMGHEPITLNIGHSSLNRWCLTMVKTAIKKCLGNSNCEWPEFPFLKERRCHGIRTFIQNNIVLTQPISHLHGEIINDYGLDCIIVGSDQIWRPKYNNISDVFLEFTKDYSIKRIGYAISLGVDNWEFTKDQTELAKSLVQQFEGVSVREDSAIHLIRENLSITATSVLDPTLLLNKEAYEGILGQNTNLKNKSYLFAYILDLNTEVETLIKQKALLLGLEPIILQADKQVRPHDTISNWLSMFSNADLVITNSFHGTIFSIMFKKQFYVIENSSRGNARIDSLLKMLNLSNRLLNSSHDDISITGIDWEMVHSIIESESKTSIDFLKHHLN